MHTIGEIDVGYDVLAANQELARENRHCLDECGITAFNIMGAIGSGKTLLITGLASTNELWLWVSVRVMILLRSTPL